MPTSAPRVKHVKPFCDLGPDLHQHLDCRWSRVPDGDLLVLQHTIPPFSVEFGLVDWSAIIVEAVRER